MKILMLLLLLSISFAKLNPALITVFTTDPKLDTLASYMMVDDVEQYKLNDFDRTFASLGLITFFGTVKRNMNSHNGIYDDTYLYNYWLGWIAWKIFNFTGYRMHILDDNNIILFELKI